MQNDAIKRAQAMQERAQASAGLGKAEEPHSSTSPQEPKRIPMPKGYLEKGRTEDEKSTMTSAHGSFLKGLQENIGNINIDSDKALLLSLIMLLSEEGADELLIMALLYMLT